MENEEGQATQEAQAEPETGQAGPGVPQGAAEAPAPPVPRDPGVSTRNPLALLARVRDLGLREHLALWLGLAGLAAVLGGAAAHVAGRELPLAMALGLLAWGLASLASDWPRLVHGGRPDRRAGLFLLLLVFYFGLALAFGLEAAQVLKPGADGGLFFLAVLFLTAYVGLSYLFELLFNWEQAGGGFYLLLGLAAQAGALVLFTQFVFVPAFALELAALALAAVGLYKRALEFQPSFSGLMTALLLVLALPLAVFVWEDASIPKADVRGFSRLVGDLNATAASPRWAPRPPSGKDKGGPEQASAIAYSYVVKGNSWWGIYDKPALASIPEKAGLQARGGWWSPDGSRMAYYNLSPKSKKEQLWVLRYSRGEMTGKAGKKEPVLMASQSLVPRDDVWASRDSQVWSPDSRYLVFSGPQKGHSRVWRVDLEKDVVVPLSGADWSGYPAYSPDGKSIAYISRHYIPPYVAISDDDGSNWQHFSYTRENAHFPAWNAAQNKVLFINAHDKFMAMKANGTDTRPFSPGELDSPYWLTPNKEKFLLEERRGRFVWTVRVSDADGRGTRKVFSGEEDEILPPVWSPDSSRIAFIVRGDGGSRIYTVGRDGSWPRHFFDTRDRLSDLSWNPKGDHLAFLVRREALRQDELWVARQDGLKPRKLYETRQSFLIRSGALSNLAWSPNGSLLAVEETIRHLGIFPSLHSIRVIGLKEGQAMEVLPFRLESRDPQFSPNGTLVAFVGKNNRWLPTLKDALWVADLR